MGSVPILCVRFNVTIDTIKLEANTDEKFRNFLSISVLPVNLTFDVPYTFKVGFFWPNDNNNFNHAIRKR